MKLKALKAKWWEKNEEPLRGYLVILPDEYGTRYGGWSRSISKLTPTHVDTAGTSYMDDWLVFETAADAKKALKQFLDQSRSAGTSGYEDVAHKWVVEKATKVLGLSYRIDKKRGLIRRVTSTKGATHLGKFLRAEAAYLESEIKTQKRIQAEAKTDEWNAQAELRLVRRLQVTHGVTAPAKRKTKKK